MKTEHAYTDAVQRREEEVREHISWFREFLTFGTELPETIRRQYGLEEDYRRYMELAESDNRTFEEAEWHGCAVTIRKLSARSFRNWRRGHCSHAGQQVACYASQYLH